MTLHRTDTKIMKSNIAINLSWLLICNMVLNGIIHLKYYMVTYHCMAKNLSIL